MADSVLYQGLTLLGFLTLTHLLLQQSCKLLRGFRVHVLSRWWRTDLRKYGGWAVVTGATDGIGKAYAEELARRGFDVVLISRSQEKLQRVANEIKQQHQHKTKIIQADFTGGPEIYPQIEKSLKDLDIGILVNNVGMAQGGIGTFIDLYGDSDKGMMDMLNCNVLSMLQMTRIILPRMVQRKKGLIINIASEAGTRPYPMITLYSSTKVFVDFFSRSLNLDLRSKGITVQGWITIVVSPQSVMPCMVATNMSRHIKKNPFMETSDDYARKALNTVGLTHRTSGCLSHSVQSYILDLFLTDYMMNSKIMAWIAKASFGRLEEETQSRIPSSVETTKMSGCVLHPGVTVLAYLALSYLIIQQLYKLLKSFRVHILSRVWRTDLKNYKGWAVVTGATDGIGKGYARELARRGLDVVLISRTLEKLQKVAREIEKESGRKVKIIQADFTRGSEIYPNIEQGLAGLDIGILVNNVGMVHQFIPAPFLDAPGDLNKTITNMLNCNVQSMLQMTRIVLPRMVQRKKGLIINISSEAGVRPLPNHCLYSATKVFMDYFSRSLNIEYSSKGITVQSVMPLLVATNMTQSVKPNLFMKTADDYAREALNTVGLTHRTSGCLSHSIQSYTVDVVFGKLLMNSSIAAKINKFLSSLAVKKTKES
ncbi:uncharacterized protein PAF06_010089 [Gastrophryne carolinensis]